MEVQKQAEEVAAKERVHCIISEWKKRKAQDEQEAKERFNSPEYKEIFKQLAEENEQRKKRNTAG